MATVVVANQKVTYIDEHGKKRPGTVLREEPATDEAPFGRIIVRDDETGEEVGIPIRIE